MNIYIEAPRKSGPLPIEEQFPEIIEEIERILYLNGFAAHKARHVDHSEHFGTTMPSLVTHLLDTFPELRKKYPKLNPSTLLHLFPPPNISTASATNYKSIIQARPYQPHDNDHHNAPKYHFCHAQVRIIFELFFYCSETSVYSCDNKNKVNLQCID